MPTSSDKPKPQRPPNSIPRDQFMRVIWGKKTLHYLSDRERARLQEAIPDLPVRSGIKLKEGLKP